MKLVCSTEPLTPALSRWERENRIQSHNKSCGWICQAVFRKTNARHLLFPPLRGEGQGEGKRNAPSP
jgi:hypothetical protein